MRSSEPNGISNAMSPTCQVPVIGCCLTGLGTTVSALRRSWAFQHLNNRRVLSTKLPILNRCCSGIHLIKFWLDISKAEQATRLEARQTDPLKQLKISDLDAYAQPRWNAYSEARDTLLAETHSEAGRWICVKTDTKMKARLNIMRHILKCIADQNIDAIHPDLETNDEILFDYDLVREGKRTLFV